MSNTINVWEHSILELATPGAFRPLVVGPVAQSSGRPQPPTMSRSAGSTLDSSNYTPPCGLFPAIRSIFILPLCFRCLVLQLIVCLSIDQRPRLDLTTRQGGVNVGAHRPEWHDPAIMTENHQHYVGDNSFLQLTHEPRFIECSSIDSITFSHDGINLLSKGATLRF